MLSRRFGSQLVHRLLCCLHAGLHGELRGTYMTPVQHDQVVDNA